MNTAYNMDCMEGMKQFPDKYFDLAVVDPPYRAQWENQPTKDMRKNGSMKHFGDKPQKNYFEELFRISKNQIIWGANNFELPPYKGFLVWRKLTISEDFTMSMAEIAYIYLMGSERHLRFLNLRRKGQKKPHASIPRKSR